MLLSGVPHSSHHSRENSRPSSFHRSTGTFSVGITTQQYFLQTDAGLCGVERGLPAMSAERMSTGPLSARKGTRHFPSSHRNDIVLFNMCL